MSAEADHSHDHHSHGSSEVAPNGDLLIFTDAAATKVGEEMAKEAAAVTGGAR